MNTNKNYDYLINNERCEKIRQKIIERQKDGGGFIMSKYDEEVEKFYNIGLNVLDAEDIYRLELADDIGYVKSNHLLEILGTLFVNSGFKVVRHYRSFPSENRLIAIEVSV